MYRQVKIGCSRYPAKAEYLCEPDCCYRCSGDTTCLWQKTYFKLLILFYFCFFWWLLLSAGDGVSMAYDENSTEPFGVWEPSQRNFSLSPCVPLQASTPVLSTPRKRSKSHFRCDFWCIKIPDLFGKKYLQFLWSFGSNNCGLHRTLWELKFLAQIALSFSFAVLIVLIKCIFPVYFVNYVHSSTCKLLATCL